MRPTASGVREGILAMRLAGKSFRVIAGAFEVPLATVKTICCRNGVKLRTMKPVPMNGKQGHMKPASVVEHRGLRVDDMPGRTQWERRMTFSLFRRNEWPPPAWRIDPATSGAALRDLLSERAEAFKGRRKR